MPWTKKILWSASVFWWLLPSLWQSQPFLFALGLPFNDTLKHVLKFRRRLKALLTLIGLKHLFMVNCVLSGLFLKGKKRRTDLGMCLKLSRCLSALQSWGLKAGSNPLWRWRMDGFSPRAMCLVWRSLGFKWQNEVMRNIWRIAFVFSTQLWVPAADNCIIKWTHNQTKWTKPKPLQALTAISPGSMTGRF